jgi:hypothetical protein
MEQAMHSDGTVNLENTMDAALDPRIEVTSPSRISATAIVSGTLVALAAALTLLVLGAAIGITALRPSADVAKGLGIGFSVWLLISLCAGAFFGGWVAAASANTLRRGTAVIYGVVTWALVTAVGASLAGGAIRSTVSGLFGAAKETAQAAASSPAVNRQVEQQGGSLQGQAGQAVESARAKLSQGNVAEKAQTGTAIGLWGLFAALLLPLGCGIGGAVVGAGRGRKRVVKEERRGEVVERRRRRDDLVPTDPTGRPVPTV